MTSVSGASFLLPTWFSNDLLEVWHTYRVPIVLSILTILLVVRTVFRSQYPPEGLLATTRPIPILDEKPRAEKQTDSAKPGPKRVIGGVKKQRSPMRGEVSGVEKAQVLVFFSSLTGNTEKFARDFAASLQLPARDASQQYHFMPAVVHDLSVVDFDDFFINPPKDDIRHFYLILMPTYNIDTLMDNFIEHLQETHNDFRIDTAPLSPLLGYSVFGFGDRENWPTEEEGFCSQAIEVDKWMAKLTGRKRAFPLGMGDTKTDARQRLHEWTQGMQDVLTGLAVRGRLGDGVPGSGDAEESDVDDADDGEELAERKVKPAKKSTVDDMEDLGRLLKQEPAPNASAPLAIDFTTYNNSASAPVTAKEMVPKTSPTHAALTKQGYTIVGSHSGVKICRWTKSALRGRGSCYKYSFYGIASHQCMETTPSLSCSNKCVFCWRHGTNPVGTTWRWQVDPPEMIFEGVKAGHYQKIKMMRGVPGVRAERFAEAMRIRHCALSLVGEPIFYPYINEFLGMLHREHISSFLVCNAQHPDQLATLKQVTQLYVSIDASNRESLRKIDRPLHRDFWERFQRCLDILREKRFSQRTVFRLTLVKGFNIADEVSGYADLVEKALPCFVEVKGVTYCGTSSSAGAGLTMQNVPFYSEVCEFVRALEGELQQRGLDYGLAAEHQHSCCTLLASGRFRKDGKWNTRINYTRFFELLESGQPFRPEDYMAETESWATWGQGGFDPRDERVHRKGKKELTAE